jgi:regulatory protein
MYKFDQSLLKKYIILHHLMIPIKNKKKNLEMTIEEMRNFASAYIEKYAPSKQQVKTYLLKKYLKSSIPSVKRKDVTDLIHLVTEDLEKTKFINDKFYSESKAKNLIQRGSSINKIKNYLISKGIKDKYIKETISKIKEKNEDQDFFSAIKICKKKRIGPARDQDNRSLFYKKDISILARSGFDFETSKKVMDIEKDDYLRIVSFL